MTATMRLPVFGSLLTLMFVIVSPFLNDRNDCSLPWYSCVGLPQPLPVIVFLYRLKVSGVSLSVEKTTLCALLARLCTAITVAPYGSGTPSGKLSGTFD